MKNFLYNTFLLAVGSALCAFSVKAILLPFGFLSSGLTGLSLIIYHQWQNLPFSVIYLLVNVPVFFIAFKFVGLRFILYTAWGIVIYSSLLLIPEIKIPLSDPLLAAAFAGSISGLGVAIILRSYGSAGGSEIISAILHKLFGFSIGMGSIIVNSVVMIISLLMFPLENVLLTIVYIVVNARVSSLIFHGLANRRVVMIISGKWNEILDDIKNGNKWRVTLLHGKGGFQGAEKSILYSVVNKSNVPSLKALVMKRDPGAFIAIMDANDVTGEKVGNQPHW
jgi:uncharacterized membrane-anchored protein YitT (DUF2179 family)